MHKGNLRESYIDPVTYTVESSLAKLTMDHYARLGLNPDCTQQDIKAAYRKVLLKTHPDKTGDPSTAPAFSAAKEAYEVLSNEEKRRQYDRQRMQSQRDPHGSQSNYQQWPYETDSSYVPSDESSDDLPRFHFSPFHTFFNPFSNYGFTSHGGSMNDPEEEDEIEQLEEEIETLRDEAARKDLEIRHLKEELRLRDVAAMRARAAISELKSKNSHLKEMLKTKDKKLKEERTRKRKFSFVDLTESDKRPAGSSQTEPHEDEDHPTKKPRLDKSEFVDLSGKQSSSNDFKKKAERTQFEESTRSTKTDAKSHTSNKASSKSHAALNKKVSKDSDKQKGEFDSANRERSISPEAPLMEEVVRDLVSPPSGSSPTSADSTSDSSSASSASEPDSQGSYSHPANQRTPAKNVGSSHPAASSKAKSRGPERDSGSSANASANGPSRRPSRDFQPRFSDLRSRSRQNSESGPAPADSRASTKGATKIRHKSGGSVSH